MDSARKKKGKAKAKEKKKEKAKAERETLDTGAKSPKGETEKSKDAKDGKGPMGPFYGGVPMAGLQKPEQTKPVQAKLAVGEAGDAYEREADVVGDRVASRMAAPAISPLAPGALAPAQREAKADVKTPEKPAEALAKAGVEEDAEGEEEEEAGPTGLTAKDVKGAQVVQHKAVQREEKPAAKDAEKEKPKAPPPPKEEKKEAPKEKPPEKPPEKEKPLAPVQKKTASEGEQTEGDSASKEEPVQTDRNPGGTAPAAPSHAAAEQAIGNKGPGSPLKPSTRDALESSMGVNLGQVRVHEDGAAQTAADSLDARAFTHGNDIWLGSGASQDDLRLMGHEAAHTVQQAGGVHRMVQRAPTAPLEKKFEDKQLGVVEADNEMITVPTLTIPKVRGKVKGAEGDPPVKDGIVLPKKVERAATQLAKWEKEVSGSAGLDTAITKKVGKAEVQVDGRDVHYLRPKLNSKIFYIGDVATIKPKMLRPIWDKKGQTRENGYDVDHKTEIQLGGVDGPSNYELLEAGANRSAGSQIKREIDNRVDALLKGAVKAKKVFKKKPDVDLFRQKHTIKAEKVAGGASLAPGGAGVDYWPLDQIKAGDQLEGLEVLRGNDLKKLKGGPKELAIYTNAAGGGLRTIKWNGKEQGTQTYSGEFLFPNVRLMSISYDKNGKSSIKVQAFKGNKYINEIEPEFELHKKDGVDWGGYIDGGSIRQQASSMLKAKGWSPITIDKGEIDGAKGFVLSGKVLPDAIPILKKLDFDFEVEGNDVRIKKTFDIGEFALPGPIQITGSSVTLSLGTDGAGMKGALEFEVKKVGTGSLVASGSTRDGLEIEGSFDFASDLFDKATVTLGYKKGKFHGAGELSIKEGKIKGVKSAKATVSYEEEVLSATGAVELSIPGIKSAAVKITYGEKEGIEVGGEFELGTIPGIKDGSGKVLIKKKAGAESWDVSASGKATVSIPGIPTAISISYDNGALTIEGTASYEKGMLKGSIMVGVTNRPVSADGKPAGDAGSTFTLYGGGSVTLKISPWLQATATIVLKPDGEVEVTGKIGLPSAINLFDEKKWEKDIFKIGIDIPIVGVAVAGQRIGIFATIQGGVSLSAGIGPGQLKELSLEVKYNPKHEDQTEITGKGQFFIPAHAGVKLFVRGALGVGIPIVSATAGLEVSGQLGLEGALTADAVVNWTPTKGLVLDAKGGVYVEPKFKFSIVGYVDVSADLWVTTIELYHKTWKLAELEYGSGLRLGMKMPVHYEEGKPFNPSLDDIEFEVPKIDPMDTLSGLIKKIG